MAASEVQQLGIFSSAHGWNKSRELLFSRLSCSAFVSMMLSHVRFGHRRQSEAATGLHLNASPLLSLNPLWKAPINHVCHDARVSFPQPEQSTINYLLIDPESPRRRMVPPCGGEQSERGVFNGTLASWVWLTSFGSSLDTDERLERTDPRGQLFQPLPSGAQSHAKVDAFAGKHSQADGKQIK